MADSSSLIAINASASGTTFDIIAVPAIGADPNDTWRFPARKTRPREHRAFSPARLRSRSRSRPRSSGEASVASIGLGPSIFDTVKSARIYLYTHPVVQNGEQRDLSYFTSIFLQQMMTLLELGSRPICFAAHSTGGLVVKQALIAASMHTKSLTAGSIARRCFAVSFFGTPHSGSTILSDNAHKDNVARLLKLNAPMSDFLRDDISSDNIEDLGRINRDFSMVALSFKKIWTFLEGKQTILTAPEASTNRREDIDAGADATAATRASTFFQTPIVDRRSAVLKSDEVEIGIEEVTEVDSTHDMLATFGGKESSQSYREFLEDLGKFALELSGKEAKDLEDLRKRIFTDINLFYESDQPSTKAYIKLWSEFPALYDLCEKGPNRCLDERREPSAEPAQPTADAGRGRKGWGRDAVRKAVQSRRDRSHSSSIKNGRPSIGSSKESEEKPASVPMIPDIQVTDLGDVETEQTSDVPAIVVTFHDPKLQDDGPPKATSAGDLENIPTATAAEIPTSTAKRVHEVTDETNSYTPVLHNQEPKVIHRTPHPRGSVADSANPDSGPPKNTNSQATKSQALRKKRKVKDAYAEMIESLEEYYGQKPPDAGDFFAPEEIKSPKGGRFNTEARSLGSLLPRDDRDMNVAQIQEAGGDDTNTLWHKAALKMQKYDDFLYNTYMNQRSGNKFIMPSKDRIKFRWIHVPTNNMLFFPTILQALAVELREPSLQRALLHKRSFNSLQHVPRHGSSHGRFMTPSCSLFEPEKYEDGAHQTFGLTSPIKDAQMSLFFPYLHWDTLRDLKSRNELRAHRRNQDKPYPVDEGIYDSCLEHQLIWFYLNSASELPLHLRRSLDQYGYPNLSNTEARDLDQILSKCTRPSESKTAKGLQGRIAQMWDKEKGKTGKKDFWRKDTRSNHDLDDQSRVLMVDTLWLWVVEQGSVVTFFPARRHGRGPATDARYRTTDVHDRIYNDVNGDPRFARQCRNCFDFAALSILHASTALLRDNDDPDLQVFGIFEEYLSKLTEQQTTSFKQFRDSQRTVETSEGEQAVRSMMANLHNREDLTALLELRDISDELRTLDKLFSEQLEVIDQMIDSYEKLDPQLKNIKRDNTEPASLNLGDAFQWLQEAASYINAYVRQSKDMQHRCESVQEAYKLLLDMKQKQANVAEASLSRLSAEVASEQNRAIMIFTIFTIIFLPLSFFTSLFGMNVKEWSGQTSNPNFHEVFLIAGCISAGIVIIALTLAFNKPIRLKVVNLFNRSIKHWPTKAIKLTYKKTVGSWFGDHRRPDARGGTIIDAEKGATDTSADGAKVALAVKKKVYAD